MKTPNLLLCAAIVTTGLISCEDKNDRYVDLDTGKHIDVVKDSKNGYMINAETKDPVAIYVDIESKDTIYGKTGKVINGHVTKTEDGKYSYVSMEHEPDKIKTEEDGSYKIKDGDYKKKVEKDGDVKIKDGDTKIKIDGETGKKTVKHN